MSFFTNKKPSVGLYILIWFLAFISSNAVVTLLDSFLSDAIVKSIDDFNNYESPGVCYKVRCLL